LLFSVGEFEIDEVFFHDTDFSPRYFCYTAITMVSLEHIGIENGIGMIDAIIVNQLIIRD